MRMLVKGKHAVMFTIPRVEPGMNQTLQSCVIAEEQSYGIVKDRGKRKQSNQKQDTKQRWGKYGEFSLYRIWKRRHIVSMALLIFLAGITRSNDSKK
jgi:hypothetical protein